MVKAYIFALRDGKNIKIFIKDLQRVSMMTKRKTPPIPLWRGDPESQL